MVIRKQFEIPKSFNSSKSMMHPQSCANFKIRHEALCGQVEPSERLSVVCSWIKCTIKPHQRPSRERNRHTWRHVPAWNHRHVAMTAVCLSSKVEKGGFTASQNGKARGVPKIVSSCSTNRHSTGETRKGPSATLYLDELRNWKL